MHEKPNVREYMDTFPNIYSEYNIKILTRGQTYWLGQILVNNFPSFSLVNPFSYENGGELPKASQKSFFRSFNEKKGFFVVIDS